MKYQNFSWVQAKMESVERGQSSVIIKFFLIRIFYKMEQKMDTTT